MIQSATSDPSPSVIARLRAQVQPAGPETGQIDELVGGAAMDRLKALAAGATLAKSAGPGEAHYSLKAPALDVAVGLKGASLNFTSVPSAWDGVTEVYCVRPGGGGADIYQSGESPYDFHTVDGNPILFFDRTVEIRSPDHNEYLRLNFPDLSSVPPGGTVAPESIEIGTQGHALHADLGPSPCFHLRTSRVDTVAGPNDTQDGMAYVYYFQQADHDAHGSRYEVGGLASGERNFVHVEPTHIPVPNPDSVATLVHAKQELMGSLGHFEGQS